MNKAKINSNTNKWNGEMRLAFLRFVLTMICVCVISGVWMSLIFSDFIGAFFSLVFFLFDCCFNVIVWFCPTKCYYDFLNVILDSESILGLAVKMLASNYNAYTAAE